MPPKPLPSYLTSGASSRAHHVLLVRLNEATSVQEEDEIISQEMEGARKVLGVKGQSTSKIAETLIVVLHCTNLRRRAAKGDDEFALVAAVQLAEGGRTTSERRIGYLYLVERLPREHELHLLLVNTIVKDLSSSTPSHILLALRTVVHLPSEDLRPAVTPLLLSKQLLKHKLPAIRHRTIQALAALHLPNLTSTQNTDADGAMFPLSLSKLGRMVAAEQDDSVLSVLFKLVRRVVEVQHGGIYHSEQDGLIDVVLAKARECKQGQISLDALRVLAVLESAVDSDKAREVEDWIIGQLEIPQTRRWQAAFLLEASHLVQTHQRLSKSILGSIAELLQSPNKPSSSTAPPTLPSPNDHYLALRCLDHLPTDLWDGLEESTMGVIMEGSNSPDDTIRRQTTRLLARMSPDLPTLILERQLSALTTSSDLSLPLNLPSSSTIEEKTRLARLETAARAMEVVEVVHPVDDVRGYTNNAVKVMTALGAVEKDVWEGGVRRMLDRVQSSPSPTVATTALSDELSQVPSESPGAAKSTLLVVLTATICDRPPSTIDAQLKQIDILSNHLVSSAPSVQELILGSLVSLMSNLSKGLSTTSTALSLPGETERARAQAIVLDTVKAVEGDVKTSRYLKKRCAQVVGIIEHDLLEDVRSTSRSSSLPDVLEAISQLSNAAAKAIAKAKRSKHQYQSSRSRSTSSTPSSLPDIQALSPRSDVAASALRYEAYASPPPVGRSQMGRHRDGHTAEDDLSDEDGSDD